MTETTYFDSDPEGISQGQSDEETTEKKGLKQFVTPCMAFLDVLPVLTLIFATVPLVCHLADQNLMIKDLKE